MYFAVFHLGYSTKFKTAMHTKNANIFCFLDNVFILGNYQCNLCIVGYTFVYLTLLRGISRCSVTHLH